jgi:ribose-phosphate pyrophosphokinase
MTQVLFAYPEHEKIAEQIRILNGAEQGKADWGHFPDGESKFRILSDVRDKHIIIVCSLNRPDEKLIRLYFFSQLLRSMGAARIVLIAPYLSYMRQDKVFHPGEGIVAKYQAKLLSTMIDELITVDPHLHRIANLSDVFTIATSVKHAAPAMSAWIKKEIPNAVLIGPDSESEQWVSKVAADCNCPFTVSEKIRKGDRDVNVQIKDMSALQGRTPVLVDDIISTGRTMIETIKHLKENNFTTCICVAVHAVFADTAYQDLMAAGATKIISCNTIIHQSNGIDISQLFKINSFA